MMKYWKIRGVLVSVCLLFLADVSAQNLLNNNWYFGAAGRGIRFNRVDNTPVLVTGASLSTGGSAVATDLTNGNVLFYTDGSSVFNISNSQMSNGFGLNANTIANQPVAVCPLPGQPDRYLIFTNTASFTTGGTISVSTVDMTLAGGEPFPTPPLGNVTTKNVVTGLAGRSEGMIIVPHDNGTDFWMITHENGTNNYTSTLIAPGPVLTHTTFLAVATPDLPLSVANFSYHEASGKIAASPQTADDNVVILNFDNVTGAITFDQYVFNSGVSGATNQATFDTEWSSNGQYLYISRHGEAGITADVLQFDIANPTTTLASVLSSPVNRSYGLQIAPDSSIYHLYETGGVFHVGTFTNTDTVAAFVVHTLDFFGPINFNGTQFSSFLPDSDPALTITFTAEATCSPTTYFANSPITFYPTVSPAADSLVWTFGDGQSSSQWSPIHTYQNPGNVNVEVIAFLNGDTASFDLDIALQAFDLQLTLVPDTTACECELPVNNGIPPCPNDTSDDFSVTVQTQGGSPTSFNWSNGDTGSTLTPDSAGYYYVVVNDASGCSAYAGVNIREYGAQDQRANIWYFGQNAGIDFNTPPGTRAVTGPIDTPEGVSVISDRNGQVIFSTNGVRVFDRNDNEIILVPPGLGGEEGSTQSVLIMPVQGDETLYYIFTTQEVHGGYTYELRYSLYDIKLNSGNGGIAQANQLLFSPSTERITGNGNWLIAHEYGNNSFRAYPVGITGIGNPIISSIGSDHVVTEELNGRGYMELGGQDQLVVALPSPGSNALEFFDFDNTTGEVSNFRSVNLNAPSGQVYGVEFAGNKVFATILGTPSALRELYIDFQGNPVLIPPGAASGPFANELGAIQTGPDGQIYVAVNNQTALGTILINPDTLLLSTFTLSGFTLAGGTRSELGLPNFVQNVGTAISGPSMTITGFCEGSPTSFVGSGTDPIDEFLWSFGDGFSSDSASVEHTYPITGVPTNYLVTLRITNRCGLDTLLSQTITIFPPPADPTFLPAGVPQPVLCNGSLTLEAEPAPGTAGYTYLWSTGETTRSIVVSQQSNISVTITNAQGCPTSGSTLVVDNRPQLDLGPDQTQCQNSPTTLLNAQNPGATFQWFLNEVANGNTAQTQTTNTTVVGVFEYKVSVLDPITTCVALDSVVFTINESPAFTALPTNTTSCGVDNGQIALTINTPLGSLFTYSIVGLTSGTSTQGTDQPTGPVLPVFSSLPADTYVIQVSDQVSGCTVNSSVGINSTTVTITSAVAQTPTCNPIAIDVQTTGITDFTGATYTVFVFGTSTVVASGPIAAANFTTTPVPVPGNYTIQVNAVVQNCLATFDLNIVSDPQTAVSFTTDLCNGQITALPAGAVSYDWSASPAGSINGATNVATVTVNPGTWTLVVTVDDGTNCPGTGTIPVTVQPPITAAFTQSDACQNQVTLSATPTGSFTYLWRNVTDGVDIVSGSSLVVGLADNGDSFTVRVQSTLTGCFATSPATVVFVAGDMQLSMTTTTPCQGTPFVLTGSSTIAGTNFQWGVNGSNIAGATSPSISRTTGGLYRLTGTLPGCSRFIEQQVTLFPVTAGSLQSRALICPDCVLAPDDCTLILDAGPNFASYQWYQGGVLLPGETTRFLNVVEQALYSVDLVNTFGCPSTDQTDVQEECKPILTAPTAFRPGSPISDNAAFYLFTYFISNEDFQLFIYNRWGELIYQSNGLDDVQPNQSKRWNGGYKNDPGKLLPAGTYSYVVKYKSSYQDNGKIQEKRGGVVLLR